MTTYTDVFGGANIYPAEVSYSAQALTASITLVWPAEVAESDLLATRIMDISASGAGLHITMPDARQASNGETVLFNNIGSHAIVVRDNAGVQVVSVGAGEAWQIYLTSNATAAGTWEAFQYGAGVSQANASALAGTGIVAVGTLLSQSVPVTTFSVSYTAGTSDRAKALVWTGTSGTLTLPAPGSVGNNWFVYVRNGGSGALTVDPADASTIDGAATKSFQPTESAIVTTDGTSYYTIGFGQSAAFVFDYTSIDISGTGTYTLSGTELNRIVYKFTGTLTGDRSVVVPATVQQYWVDNSTSGAYTVTIKTSAGSGPTISSGQRAIFYCDGTNVVDADTSTLSTPIAIAQGGTGATSASGARISLGGGSTGIALFVSADSAAAWAALGVAPSGVVDGGTF